MLYGIFTSMTKFFARFISPFLLPPFPLRSFILLMACPSTGGFPSRHSKGQLLASPRRNGLYPWLFCSKLIPRASGGILQYSPTGLKGAGQNMQILEESRLLPVANCARHRVQRALKVRAHYMEEKGHSLTGAGEVQNQQGKHLVIATLVMINGPDSGD